MDERRSESRPYLEEAYNRVWHLMAELEEDRDKWRTRAIVEELVILFVVAFLVIGEIWGRY